MYKSNKLEKKTFFATAHTRGGLKSILGIFYKKSAGAIEFSNLKRSQNQLRNNSGHNFPNGSACVMDYFYFIWKSTKTVIFFLAFQKLGSICFYFIWKSAITVELLWHFKVWFYFFFFHFIQKSKITVEFSMTF